MKRLLIALFIFISCSSMSLFAQKQKMRVDLGSWLSFCLTSEDQIAEHMGSDPFEIQQNKILFIFYSTRIGIDCSLRYMISDSFSLGVEAGFGIIYFPGNIYILGTDIPLRAVLRYGADNSFIQGFAGYNINNVTYSNEDDYGSDPERLKESFYTGFEFGVKISQEGFTFGISSISGMFKVIRFHLGFTLPNYYSF